MRKIIMAAILVASAGTAAAQSSNGVGQATSGAEAGARAETGPISFAGSEPATRVSTTPPVYTPPSMFGGANNCGMSDTAGLSVTGFGIGGSRASESANCNAREDTAIAYKLGLPDVAKMRFLCFGADANRMAYEATGGVCPRGATAKGIPADEPQQTARYMP